MEAAAACARWKMSVFVDTRRKMRVQMQGRIPLSEEMHLDPLCACGRGKDVEGMSKVDLWSKLAPYVTRIALSPLFPISYLEAIGRDPQAKLCSVCRGKHKPNLKLMICTVCKRARYCSRVGHISFHGCNGFRFWLKTHVQACQKKDWSSHKHRCKASYWISYTRSMIVSMLRCSVVTEMTFYDITMCDAYDWWICCANCYRKGSLSWSSSEI